MNLILFQGSTVESAIRRYNDPDIKWSSQGMMRLTPEAMKRLFHPTIEKIKATIGEVLNNPEVKGERVNQIEADIQEYQSVVLSRNSLFVSCRWFC